MKYQNLKSKMPNKNGKFFLSPKFKNTKIFVLFLSFVLQSLFGECRVLDF